MTRRKIDTEAIKAMGYDVYTPQEPYWQTYAFYTDGKRIAYIECDRFGGYKTSTVHVPNKQSGTGFCVDECEPLSRELLERAFVHAPNWAKARDRASVVKYTDVGAFFASKRLIKA